MKTVAERVAEVCGQITTASSLDEIHDQLAKQLTQQAAEWQIALNEAETKYESSYKVWAEVNKYNERALATEKERGAQAVEAAVQKAGEAWAAGHNPPLIAASCRGCGKVIELVDVLGAIKHERGCSFAQANPVRNQTMGCLLEGVVSRLDELEARLDTIQKGG